MRHAYDHKEEVLRKGERARRDMIEHYSLEKMGQKLIKELNRIDRILNGQSIPEEDLELPVELQEAKMGSHSVEL